MKNTSYFDKRHPVIVSPSLWEMGFKATWLKIWTKFKSKRKSTNNQRDSPA